MDAAYTAEIFVARDRSGHYNVRITQTSTGVYVMIHAMSFADAIAICDHKHVYFHEHV